MPGFKKARNSVSQSDDKYRQTIIGDYFPNSTRAIVKFKSLRMGKENNDNMEESTTKNISLPSVFDNNLITTCRKSSLPFDLPSYETNNIRVSNLKMDSFETTISSSSESCVTPRSRLSLSANVSLISSAQKHKKPLEDSSSDEDFIPSPKRTRQTRKLSSETEDNSCRTFNRGNTKLNCKRQILNSSKKKSNTLDKDKTHCLQKKSNDSAINNRASCSFNKSTSFSSNTSNDTIICNEIYNFDITEDEIMPCTNENIKIQSTPPQKIAILSNIVCNRSPQKLSLQKSNPPKSPRQLTKLNTKLKKNTSPKKSNLSTSVVQEHKNDEEDTWSPMCLTLFRNITKFIFSHKHLATMFARIETDFLNDFLNMNNDKYKLFCFKLYMRQSKWQNIIKFTEAIKLEMSNIEVKSMYDFLLEKNFVVSDMSSDSCVNLLHTLLAKDIIDICKNFKIKTANCKKGELIEKLLKHCNVQATLTLTVSTEQVLRKEINKKMGICVKMNPNFRAIFKKLHFAYTFTSNDFEKDADIYWFLSQIQSKDIFMPTYHIDQEVVIFSSIQEFSEYSNASDCKRDIESCFATKNFLQMLDLCETAYKRLKEYDEAIIDINHTSKPAHLLRFSAHYKYISALSLGTKYLPQHYPEKVKEFLLYLINNAKLGQHMRGIWLNSLVKVYYVYLKRYEEAADKLMCALKDKSLSDVDLQTLTWRGQLMKNRKTNPLPELVKNQISFLQDKILDDFPFTEISSQTTHNNTTGGKRLYIKKDDDETSILSVEKVALDHYRTKGYANGIHCEGRLFCTLFCVLFWDIIYDSNVNGAFILETQSYPLDLIASHFYTNRQNSIDQRLNEIKSDWPLGQLENFMLEIWENHSHKRSLISQNLISNVIELYEIVLCIGRSKLAKILERIIKNYGLYHSGLPDLFLWKTNSKKCKFVEVKGDRDKLSDKQRIWLNFLRSIECDVEVCHVHTIGSKYRAKAVTMRKLKSNA